MIKVTIFPQWKLITSSLRSVPPQSHESLLIWPISGRENEQELQEPSVTENSNHSKIAR